MKRLLLSLLAATLTLPALAQQHSRALFLGNSYTYVNDLPALLRQLVLAGGDTLSTEQNTPGGYTFEGHSTNATSLAFLATPGFDFLILQEQSQRPSFPQSQVQTDVYPYATQLDDAYHQSNPCGQTVFYMTWGRKLGDAQNCQFWPPVCTYEGMQYELRRSYLNMAQQNEAIVAPVGIAWWEAMLRDTVIELYNADQSHPSLNGSYLAACVFYGTMYRRSPLGLTYLAGLDPTTATFLQQVAHDVVFDSLSTWRIGLDDLSAAFSHSSAGPTASFTDLSANATTWAWDFGDGGTSTLQNPQHTYAASGTYTVTLTTSDGCDSLSTTDTVQIVIAGISPAARNLSVHPVPAHGSVHVSATLPQPGAVQLQLSDIAGRTVWQAEAMPQGSRLDFPAAWPGLSAGSYILTARCGTWMETVRVVLE